MSLSKNVISMVISEINKGLVPNDSTLSKGMFARDWFIKYFSFLGDQKLIDQLSDAYYQARFTYKVMSELQLRMAKNKGIIKFQIIQYASICEAILDFILEGRFKDEISKTYGEKVYKFANGLANDTKIYVSDKQVYLCYSESRKGRYKSLNIKQKMDFAVEKGIFSKTVGDSLTSLYDLRNNVHILKAYRTDYFPKPKESKNAYMTMNGFVKEAKSYLIEKPIFN